MGTYWIDGAARRLATRRTRREAVGLAVGFAVGFAVFGRAGLGATERGASGRSARGLGPRKKRRTAAVCASGCRYTTVAAGVAAVKKGGTVTVGLGVYPTNLTLGKNVTIIGEGPGGSGSDTILDGGQLGSIFVAANGVTVTLRNLRVRNGRAPQGGGLYVDGGAVTLDNVVVTGNQSDQDGGGIHVQAGSVTMLNASSIIANTAGGSGGGVSNRGTLTMRTGTSIANNQAADYGGGVRTVATMVMDAGSSVSGNTAGTSGGGIINDGTLTKNGTVSGNTPNDCVNANSGTGC